ncbi:MAG: hypothetical protein HQL80_02075 [Magnetococcales bacterium]|nr:hypothetical protein [Magnetococcales bacterium]MBF0583004.1 hypothetical protein [Magnetococcales bacterium]
MPDYLRWMLQGVCYALFCSIIMVYSTKPAYTYLPPGQGEIKLAFKHASQRKEACTERTPQQLMALPPNMRRKSECSRERANVVVDIILDDQHMAQQTFGPPGLHRDGTVFVYSKFPLPAGEHQLTVGMRNSAREQGHDFSKSARVTIQPGQLLVVGFDDIKMELTFH